MQTRLLAAAACLLAGCGAEEGRNRAPDTAQIRELSTPKNIVAPPENTTELLPLSREDISRAGFGTAPCAFVAEGRLLIVASGESALARFRGGLRRLPPSGLVDLRGAYFEDREIGISIGRDMNEEGPARARITDRRAEEQRDMIGDWTCRTAS